jgi:hypothetical protein
VVKYFALVISVVFQPLLMPTLVFGLIFFAVPEATSIPAQFKETLFFLIVISTLVIPMISIIGFRLSGTVKSLHMKDIKDRILPFSITTLFYAMIVYYFFEKSEFDPILWQTLALITVTILGLTLTTIFWKMSAHMTGVGGLLGLVFILGMKFQTFQVLFPMLLCLGLTGIIASCRLFLNAHKPIEVYIGFLYGFLMCLAGFYYIWS